MFLLRAIRSNKCGAVRRRWNRLMYFHSCVIHSSKDTTRYMHCSSHSLPMYPSIASMCASISFSLFSFTRNKMLKKKHFKCTTTIDGWCHIYSNCSGVFIPIKTHQGNDFILATRKPKTYNDTGEREIEKDRELSISRSRSSTSDLRFLFSTIYFAIETITSHHLRAEKRTCTVFLLLFRIKALLYSSYCSHCGYVS